LTESVVRELLEQYNASHLTDFILEYCKHSALTISELRDIAYFHFEKMGMTPHELEDYILIYTCERDWHLRIPTCY